MDQQRGSVWTRKQVIIINQRQPTCSERFFNYCETMLINIVIIVMDGQSRVNIILSIYEIYIAPLQGYYSEAIPAQARAQRKVLRRL